MKRFGTAVLAILFALSPMVLSSCGNESVTAADGLNLHAVADLIMHGQARDGEHFEESLNGSGINNLDLDHDGHKDIISVHEYGDGAFRGFSLSTMLGDQSVQQIAEIQFQQHPSGITFQIHGNPQIYGPNYYIRSAQPMSVGQAVLLAWLFVPHRVVYISPYNRFSPPPAYVAVRVIPVVEYRKITNPVVARTSVAVQQVAKPVIQAPASVKSPNEGKSSSAIVAPLAKPTEMQKQFQARPETKKMQQATGFANPSTNPAVPAVPKPGSSTPSSAPIASPTPATKPTQSPVGTTTVTPQPTPSNPTAMDKQFQQRPSEKDMKGATGFVSPSTSPVPKAQEPVGTPVPSTVAPKKEPTAPTPLVAPKVETPKPVTPQPQAVTPSPALPRAMTPTPTPQPAPRPSTPTPSPSPSKSK